jgi:peptidoglycan/LPS O-acetylase OafA/YrhL
VSAPVRQTRFPALDSIRGLAAVAVLAVHSIGVYARGAGDDWVRPWVERLDVAVPIFLMLSGFLLYRPFVIARHDGEPLPSLSAYGWRRVLRVVPGYWVALVVAAVALGLPGVLTAHGAPHYFLFLQIYDRDTLNGGIPQTWTLCTDVAFYLLLPVVVVAVWRLGRRGGLRGELVALAVLVLVSEAWKAWVLLGGTVGAHTVANEPWLVSLPAFLDMFAVGMALAVASVHWEDRGGPPRWVTRRPSAWWLAALALFALSAVVLDGVDPRGYSHQQVLVRHALHLVIAVCVLVPGVIGIGATDRLLRTRPLRRLGTVSYGFYLYHLTVLGLLGRWGLAHLEGTVPKYVLWFGVSFAGSLLLAELSWRLIERPALRFKPPLRPRRRRAAARPAPAPRG